MEIEFVKDKETKGTVRYMETGEPATHSVGGLYIKKPAAEKLGNPEKITVT